MHYYIASDLDAAQRARIRELEEQVASAEVALDVAWDELEQSRQREQRLLWTALALGTVAVAAIMQTGWLLMER